MLMKPILQLGNPKLYDISDEITRNELVSIKPVVEDLHNALMDYRKRWGCGNGIAASQIGVSKRLVYTHIDNPKVYINPVLYDLSDDMVEVWDDCMSFPEIIVKVKRHRLCKINYRDIDWQEHNDTLNEHDSILLQHEVDHLNGILAMGRAIDSKSFALKSQKGLVT